MRIAERTNLPCGQTGWSLEYLVDFIQSSNVDDIMRLLILVKRAYLHLKCIITSILHINIRTIVSK